MNKMKNIKSNYNKKLKIIRRKNNYIINSFQKKKIFKHNKF